MTGRPGAVVVGGDYQGLAIVRSLGRRGIDAIVLDDERSISRYSRYAPRFHRVPDLRDEERTVAALLDLGGRYALNGWVVFPTREETVAALSRNRERLLAQYRIPTPAWSAVKWAWDKRNTYSRAAELGMAVPRTWTLRDAGGLSSIDGDPPYVIKPAIKEHFFYKTGHKAWRADTRAELESHVRRAQGLIGVSEVLVQELIPGSGDCQLAYCAFFKDGEAHAKMTVRRARQHPAEFGRASTFVETIDAPELEEPSERFLRSIGYYGLVELEYKRDPRDGVTKLLDVNARTWGYHGLGQQAGIDFPAYLYYDQIGSPLAGAATARARAGATWIRLSTDLPTAILEIARGSLDWREFIRSVRAADVGAVLARDDPRPALAELALLPYLAVKRGF